MKKDEKREEVLIEDVSAIFTFTKEIKEMSNDPNNDPRILLDNLVGRILFIEQIAKKIKLLKDKQ